VPGRVAAVALRRLALRAERHARDGTLALFTEFPRKADVSLTTPRIAGANVRHMTSTQTIGVQRADRLDTTFRKGKVIMPTPFIQRLGLWMSACVLVAATGGVVRAEAPVRADEGQVVAIEIYRASDNKPINGGTLIGGVAGGVIGHQIGSGRGNTAATIAGAIGGAVVGNEIEKKQGQAMRYRFNVQLDTGSSLIVEDTYDLNLRVGDRVRLENGHLYRI